MPFTATSAASRARSKGRVTRLGRNVVGALIAVLALVFGTASIAGAVGVSHKPAVNQSVAASQAGQVIKGQLPFDLAAFNRTFHQGMVAVDGAKLHYYLGGTGPALLLLHGWPETSWAWHDVMPGLAKTHTVIALDLPGLGQSTIPAGGYDAVSTAHRVRETVHALGYNQIEILAHDVGTLVAYPYARDFPSEVTRMAVLEAPLNGFGLEQAYNQSFHFLLNAAASPIPEKLIDNGDVSTYLGMLFNGAKHPEAIDQHVYFNAYASPARRTAGYNYYRAFAANAANNQANASKRLTMPVLAMAGIQSLFTTAVEASFKQVANDVRGVVATDSGHFIPEEDPAFLTACANLFFGPAGVTPPAGLTGCAA
ncbi:MAG: alpha/beta fold hydrolase [Jatrophihabitans sp.]